MAATLFADPPQATMEEARDHFIKVSISVYTDIYTDYKEVKPGFTTYQPQIKYFCALSKIEEKATKNNKTNII